MNHITGGRALLDVDLILDKAQIETNMKVADLGCGSLGRYVFPAAEIVGSKGRVYAVDILKTALETVSRRARVENTRNVRTIWSDIEIFGATKIETCSLDIVFLINTLYQSHKRPEIIRESTRMIKNQGKIIIVEWKNIASPLGPPSEFRVKKDNLIKGSKKLGLKFEEEFFAGKYHYGLVFIKI
ncbi:methyltransferase domain-containing protein [Candidatus Parcubacteria bacterium]|nr:methyltransferase domain-containing protein [Candidatus Parcubacteria bacterium]